MGRSLLSDVSLIKGVIERKDVEKLKLLHVPAEQLNVPILNEPFKWISEREKETILFEAYLAEIAYCTES